MPMDADADTTPYVGVFVKWYSGKPSKCSWYGNSYKPHVYCGLSFTLQVSCPLGRVLYFAGQLFRRNRNMHQAMSLLKAYVTCTITELST